MSALDLTLLAIIGVSMLFGLMRGFIGALASVLAWLLAGWVAFHYGAEVAAWLSDDGPPGSADLLGGYALSFVAVMVVGSLIAAALLRHYEWHSVFISGAVAGLLLLPVVAPDPSQARA